MELRRELLLMIGVLVGLNLLLAFGGIGLFVRMGPAIERIVQENTASIVAGEEILVELALSGASPLPDGARARVNKAFTSARHNQTEKEEGPILDALGEALPAAMSGDSEARARAVIAIRRLIEINHQAMRGVDEEARRLGHAGAWSAVFIGFSSFMLSILILVRLQKRFVRPLVDLHDVLEGARHGNRFRRCRLADAPREVVQVAQSVNDLLDERLTRAPERPTAPSA